MRGRGGGGAPPDHHPVFFGIRSAICGAAPSSAIFVFERVVSGVGSGKRGGGIVPGAVGHFLSCGVGVVDDRWMEMADRFFFSVFQIAVVVYTRRPPRAPSFPGMLGAVFGLAGEVGPLLGG